MEKLKTIPDNMVYPFSMFMIKGGYQIEKKKSYLLFKKGQLAAKIYCDKGFTQVRYQMNEHCVDRFFLFNQQWFKYGKTFVCSLIMEANVRLRMAAWPNTVLSVRSTRFVVACFVVNVGLSEVN